MFATPTTLKTRYGGQNYLKIVDKKGELTLPNISIQISDKIKEFASRFQLSEYKDFDRLKKLKVDILINHRSSLLQQIQEFSLQDKSYKRLYNEYLSILNIDAPIEQEP